MGSATLEDLQHAANELAGRWRAERTERQRRRHLDPADFEALAAIGFLRSVVPGEQGGLWSGVEASTRSICSVLRTLAAADASVALVAAMHPAVLGYWLATDDPSQPSWTEQRRAVFASAAAGSQWGTITSEPGSGGDILRTRTRGVAAGGAHSGIPGDCYLLTGDKHFGSGFGISDFMFTTARVDGEDVPAAFLLDMRDARRDGDSTVTVTAEWDGMGMAATQSHAARLEGARAVRLAYEGPVDPLVANTGGFILSLFTAVVLGVLDEAIGFARDQLGPRRDTLRPFEQVEWSRAELDHWLACQAYEGGLRAVEAGDRYAALRAGIRAKTAVAELSEQTMRRITQVVGGGSFSRRSPVASWFEDVRALGFLRPPWGLAFDTLFATSFDG
jgi:alkylation response protein AidB-like acyl-CoA dehydrogenase